MRVPKACKSPDCGNTFYVNEMPSLPKSKRRFCNACLEQRAKASRERYRINGGQRWGEDAWLINAGAGTTAARNREIAHGWICKYLSENPCVGCGETDIIVLQFDRDSPRPFAKRSGYSVAEVVSRGLPLDMLIEAANKCVVRCANCRARAVAQAAGANYYKVAFVRAVAPAPPQDTVDRMKVALAARRPPQLSEDERERLRIAERDRRMALRTARDAVRAGEGGLVPPAVPQPHEFSGARVVEPEVPRACAADLPTDGVGGDEPTPEQPADDAAQEDVRDDAAAMALGEPVGKAAGGRGEDDAVDAEAERALDAARVDARVVGRRRVVRRLRQRDPDGVGEPVPAGEDPERFE